MKLSTIIHHYHLYIISLLLELTYCNSFITTSTRIPSPFPTPKHKDCTLLLLLERRPERTQDSIRKNRRQNEKGKAKQKFYKLVSQEDRISELRIKEGLNKAERAELKGLLGVQKKFEEQYNPLLFSDKHLRFKSMHNDIFLKLSLYCSSFHSDKKINVFFLDGPDGGTAKTLIQKSNIFDPNQLFVANRHESSCNSLRISGGGMLPDKNVICANAADVFRMDFRNIEFSCYYFDGCGGHVPQIIHMISEALEVRLKLKDSSNSDGPIVIGYSLLGDNKNFVQKELLVSQHIRKLANSHHLRMSHALDDPLQYGILCDDIQKVDDSTFTTWIVLEPKD